MLVKMWNANQLANVSKNKLHNGEKSAPKPSLVKRVAREMLSGRDNVLFDRVTGVL